MFVVPNINISHDKILNIKLGFYRLPAILLYAMLSACASLSPQAPVSSTSTNSKDTIISSPAGTDADLGWWQVAFHRKIQEDEEPAWHMDTLVAYKIIKPILDKHEQQISLWRFHRRAVADKSGHQFSFIFYSERVTGELIYKLVKEDKLVQALQE